MELSQFSLEYLPRIVIKGHTLANFVVEYSIFEPDSPNQPNAEVSLVTNAQLIQSLWTLYVDKSLTLNVSGAGMILTSPEGFKVQQAIHIRFKATNNEVEYEAILAGLRLAKSLEVRHLVIFSDSQLVVKQIVGEYEA